MAGLATTSHQEAGEGSAGSGGGGCGVEAEKVEAVTVEVVKVEAEKVEAVKVWAVKMEAMEEEAVKVEAVREEAVKVEAVKVEAVGGRCQCRSRGRRCRGSRGARDEGQGGGVEGRPTLAARARGSGSCEGGRMVGWSERWKIWNGHRSTNRNVRRVAV
jgi:hypothetical protein